MLEQSLKLQYGTIPWAHQFLKIILITYRLWRSGAGIGGLVAASL